MKSMKIKLSFFYTEASSAIKNLFDHVILFDMRRWISRRFLLFNPYGTSTVETTFKIHCAIPLSISEPFAVAVANISEYVQYESKTQGFFIRRYYE